jgi:hypothetical protein
MSKLIIALALAGFVMLLTATSILAWLNWSSRLYMPIITALLVGTATGFVSIISTLKASTIKNSFASSVVVYRDALRAPVAIPKSVAAVQRIDLASLLGQLKVDPATTVTTDQVFNTSLEAAQYALFKMVAETHRGGWATVNLGGASTTLIRKTPDVRLSDLPPATVKEALKGNRFASLPSEEFYWLHGRFPVPPGTTVELLHSPSSSQTGVEKRIIRLEKPLFFQLTIEIEPLGLDSGIPADLEIGPDDRSRAGTLNLKISAIAHFEALTAGNECTEEYKAWAAWLIESLHARLGA